MKLLTVQLPQPAQWVLSAGPMFLCSQYSWVALALTPLRATVMQPEVIWS